MPEPNIIRALERIVGKKNVSTEKTELICPSYDASRQKFLPDDVVYSETTKEISLVMTLANAEKVPVFPCGVGSGSPSIFRTAERSFVSKFCHSLLMADDNKQKIKYQKSWR